MGGLATLGVCLSLAGAPNSPPVFVPVTQFTLAWTHSIEKVRWEEDYRVELDPQSRQPVLHATVARIKGSAAGMEPPPDAVLKNGWYHYTPTQTLVPELRLTRSEFTKDYDWCVDGHCQPMSTLIASDAGITRARACFHP
ncbi:MAG: DUF1850 domain-containing protein [Rhodoferax sp.]|nr:DUF1850 domain-containing protein [Rhodoferax sp.]NCP55936.1 DUF1850 domain-containing protein [Rhodoferax sp.]PIW07259.1 MAG: DUF1850 domain-containing protein [Comamonadaceae bacterium CG17_big_fil_post_rev_8_21_14_2_50_60_13]PJC12537.1 MAG: DUF1850 domain-containing protein [Comamonadaceae bacterium CG_4_9_14_0_8_um_filter_60_18]